MDFHNRYFASFNPTPPGTQFSPSREVPHLRQGPSGRNLGTRSLHNLPPHTGEVIVLSDSDDEPPAKNTAPTQPIDLTNETEDQDDIWRQSSRPIPPSRPPHLPRPSVPLPRSEDSSSNGEATWLSNPQALRPELPRDPTSATRPRPGSWTDYISTNHLNSQLHAFSDIPVRPVNNDTPSSSSDPFPKPSRPDPSHKRRKAGETRSEIHHDPSPPDPTPAPPTKSSMCNNCTRTRVQCDGHSPCTPCTQRGVICSYQNAPSAGVQQKSLVVKLKVPRPSQSASVDSADSAMISRDQSVSSSSGSRSAIAEEDVHASDKRFITEAEPKIILQPPHETNAEEQSHALGTGAHDDGEADDRSRDIPGSETTASELNQQFEYGSDASASPEDDINQVPADHDLEFIKGLVDTFRSKMHLWHEQQVQAELRQATVDMRKWPEPKIDPTLPEPFKALTEQRRAEAGILPSVPQPGIDASSSTRQQDRPQQRKLVIIRAPEKFFSTGSTMLPKYKAIGRVSSSFLAPNCRTAKYRPYDAEDEIQDPEATEKYAELEQRYDNNYESLTAQRYCQELVWEWKPWVEELLFKLRIKKSDVLYFFTQDCFDPDRQLVYDWPLSASKAWREEQMRRCRTCELADPESRRTHFSETFDGLQKPDDRDLVIAGLAAHAFHEATGVSLWHIALGGLLQPRYEDSHAMTRKKPSLCVVCFRHECPDHGSFEEPPHEDHDVKDPLQVRALINDKEQDHNLRKFVSPPPRVKNENESHICGLFCVEPSRNLRQIIGRQTDGSVAGDSRPTVQGKPILGDEELCGPACFWDVAHRRDLKISEVKFQPFLSQSQKVLVESVMKFYFKNKRGPCLIARIIKDVSCQMVFHHMIFQIFKTPHPVVEPDMTSDSSTAQLGPGPVLKKKKAARDPDLFTNSRLLEKRPPFFPCSHEGPCNNNPACTCAQNKVHCERYCGCDDSCGRRFRGCNCAGEGNKVCFKDNRCACWAANRECDPFLCGKCGVIDVLDSSNKYREEVRKGRCRNNRIQLGLPAATTKAPSQVQGYGLYSRADIPAGEFIGEYTGEVVSIPEGDRRGAMYHVLNQEYLFSINKNQEIDASNHGNKMRFMNNSLRDENINVEPRKLFCNGVIRVGLFAKTNIKAGQELLYNYGYQAEVVKHFWEPGDRPANARLLFPLSQERIARRTGPNKVGDEEAHDAWEESRPSPVLARRTKRKRGLEESPDTPFLDSTSHHSAHDTEISAEDLIPLPPEIDDSEDSDYETNGHVSEDADLEDDSDEESDVDSSWEVPGPRNVPHHVRPNRSSRSTNPHGQGSSSSRSGGGSKSRERRGPAEGTLRGSQSDKSVDSRDKNKHDAKTGRRKRKIGPHDKRFGGKAQQQAWRTRRLNESLGAGSSPM